jgi:hypothetical protein
LHHIATRNNNGLQVPTEITTTCITLQQRTTYSSKEQQPTRGNFTELQNAVALQVNQTHISVRRMNGTVPEKNANAYETHIGAYAHIGRLCIRPGGHSEIYLSSSR